MPSGPTATSVFGPRGKRGRQNRETGTVVSDQASLVRKWPSRLSLLPHIVSAVIKEHSREIIITRHAWIVFDMFPLLVLAAHCSANLTDWTTLDSPVLESRVLDRVSSVLIQQFTHVRSIIASSCISYVTACS